jgi:hypothetical protein
MLRWSIEAASAGVFPHRRHDARDFADGDETRRAKAGVSMGVRFALQYLKGDWSEYCGTLGFRNWASNSHPCIWCTATKETLYDTTHFSPAVFPHRLLTLTDYEAACTKCEHHVRIATVAEHSAVKAALFYDKRKHGSRGKTLDRDIPSLGLLHGDRLEPSDGLRDIGAFDNIELPCDIVFWRLADESISHHRNPIFSGATGVTYDCLIVDVMHCLHLGVVQRYVSFVWWSLISANAFRVVATGEDELISLSVHRLRAQLFEFYPRYRKQDPEHSTLTELSDLSMKTLGPKNAYMLKTKAAMTRPLLPFSVELLRRFGGDLPGNKALHAAGVALNKLLLALRSEPDVPSPGAVQDPDQSEAARVESMSTHLARKSCIATHGMLLMCSIRVLFMCGGEI